MCNRLYKSVGLALMVIFGVTGCGERGASSGGKGVGGKGGARSTGRARPVGIDCEVVAWRQKVCVDALVRAGGEEMVKSIRARIDKLPAGQRQRRLAAVEQTRKQIGKLMRQQLVGPNVLATCRARFGGGRGLSGATARAAQQLKVCLAMSDCGALARCYWKVLGAQRVGGVPGR